MLRLIETSRAARAAARAIEAIAPRARLARWSLGRLREPGAAQRARRSGGLAARTRTAGEASLLAEARLAAERARNYLLSIQAEDGHWCGELEGDTILESEYVLMLYFLGRSGEPRARKAAEYVRRRQLEQGGWAIYPGGPPEVSASVKAYFALKLLGDDPDAPHMAKARRAILDLGGVEAANSFTKIYLAIFGQYPWERCPAIPPEMILLPRWFLFNIYEMSSWSRGIVVPLSLVWAHRPYCPVPARASISELYRDGARVRPVNAPSTLKGRLWRTFFAFADSCMKEAEKLPVKPWRRRAIRTAERWILARLDKSDGLGAIFPPIVNAVLAFRCLGYPPDHPVVAGQVRELEKLEIEDGDTLRLQPCFSPVWDTALALNSLVESGLPADHPALLRAARWLLDREVREAGDWRLHARRAEPGGWYFEYANEFYPDCDDTAQVLTALAKVRFPDPREEERRRAAIERGVRWLLAMQNRDGGWASFDRGCDTEAFTYIPFADHNAMIDPSCEDITGRVLETLHVLGHGASPAARRAVRFLLRKQLPDGTWYGRWGCNYIYGTWLALWGLTRDALDSADGRIERAAAWLQAHQNLDGGFGESLRSYDEPETKGIGPSTAAQTAWAALGLMAAGRGGADCVRRAVSYLVASQRPDGSWQDEPWTATGFPRVFYLRYHLYATYFPLLALAQYANEAP